MTVLRYKKKHTYRVTWHTLTICTGLCDCISIHYAYIRVYVTVVAYPNHMQGRIQDFKLGGAQLKKIAPSGGRRENFRGISCKKSRFYAKKSYFCQLRREARKFLGYFMWKITILHQQIIFFPILGGVARRVRPPLDPPLYMMWSSGLGRWT